MILPKSIFYFLVSVSSLLFLCFVTYRRCCVKSSKYATQIIASDMDTVQYYRHILFVKNPSSASPGSYVLLQLIFNTREYRVDRYRYLEKTISHPMGDWIDELAGVDGRLLMRFFNKLLNDGYLCVAYDLQPLAPANMAPLNDINEEFFMVSGEHLY